MLSWDLKNKLSCCLNNVTTATTMNQSVIDAWVAKDVAKYPQLAARVMPARETYECSRLADLKYANRLCSACCAFTSDGYPCNFGVYVYGFNEYTDCDASNREMSPDEPPLDDIDNLGYWPEREIVFRRLVASDHGEEGGGGDWHRWFCKDFVEGRRRGTRKEFFARMGRSSFADV